MTSRTQPPTGADVKTCRTCGETKPLEDFHRMTKSADGLQSSCKVCRRAYNKANRQRLAGYQRAYRQAHHERYIRYRRAWYQANRKHHFEYNRAYRHANRNAFVNYESRRRARRGCAVSQRWVVDYSLGDPLACWWCGRGLLGAKPHLDHVMPISLGGPAGPSNEVLTCETCNTRKRAKHPLVWLAEIAS